MKQAKRLFSKSKKQSLQESPSSMFKSKIVREFPDQSKRSSIGPGQYEVALPIVKPKFQAIRKNNNTLIIKVNQKLSPAFQSLEPRFKERKNQKSQQNQSEQMFGFSSKEASSSLDKQNKMSIGMKNRLKKLAEIINIDQIKEKQKLNVSLNNSRNNSSKLQTLESNNQILNSLKLYKKQRERLHFLLKNIKTRNQSKGFEWSKYRQTKGNLYNLNNVPGPGSYDEHRFHSTNRYMETNTDKSWQFKSLTKRQSFGKIGEQKEYQVARSRNHFVSEIDRKFYKVDSIPIIPNFNQEENQQL